MGNYLVLLELARELGRLCGKKMVIESEGF